MGDDKVIPISSKHHSSTSWTPEQCAEQFIEDIHSGKIKPTRMLILFMEDSGGGGETPSRWFVNMNSIEELAYLQLALAMALVGWRGTRDR